MSGPLTPKRYLHTIHAAPECSRLRNIYLDVFGGIAFSEGYYPPEDRDAVLLYVADHMIEVMSPRDNANMDFTYARYLAKAGPGYHSVSFKVDSSDAAQARCRELGIEITTTGPGLIFLHPKSTGGLIMELTEHYIPNDPWDLPNWRRDWAAGRPSRPHALAHIVCAPRKPEAAIAFLTEALGGSAGEASHVDWPQPATATLVQVSDVTLLVLDPDDPDAGPLVEFANGPNGGVYALAWEVADPDAAAQWFGANHTATIPPEELPGGTGYSHAFLLDGARHWFVKV